MTIASQPSHWSSRVEHADLSGMLTFAFRYALGRRSTAPSTVEGWLVQYGHVLEDWHRRQIAEDIESAMKAGWAGDECDRETWRRVAERMRGGPGREPNREAGGDET